MLVCVCSCVYTMAHTWRSEDSSRWCSSHSSSCEAGCLVHQTSCLNEFLGIFPVSASCPEVVSGKLEGIVVQGRWGQGKDVSRAQPFLIIPRMLRGLMREIMVCHPLLRIWVIHSRTLIYQQSLCHCWEPLLTLVSGCIYPPQITWCTTPSRRHMEAFSSAPQILWANINPHKGVAVLAPFPSCSWLCLLSTVDRPGFLEMKTSRRCEGTCSPAVELMSAPPKKSWLEKCQSSLPQRLVQNVFNYAVSFFLCIVNFRAQKLLVVVSGLKFYCQGFWSKRKNGKFINN